MLRNSSAQHSRELNLSFPKIISGRNGGAVPTRSGLRRWHRSAAPPDTGARLCPRLSAYGPHCNRPRRKKEFAAGALRQRSAFGPGTLGVQCSKRVQDCEHRWQSCDDSASQRESSAGWNFRKGQLSDYGKTLAGFANADGGVLIFGVTDKPTRIVGINDFRTGPRIGRSYAAEAVQSPFRRTEIA
jgi:hypothetical protein